MMVGHYPLEHGPFEHPEEPALVLIEAVGCHRIALDRMGAIGDILRTVGSFSSSVPSLCSCARAGVF